MLEKIELWISIFAGLVSIISFFFAKAAYSKVKSLEMGDVTQTGKSNNNQVIHGNGNKQSNSQK